MIGVLIAFNPRQPIGRKRLVRPLFFNLADPGNPDHANIGRAFLVPRTDLTRFRGDFRGAGQVVRLICQNIGHAVK